MNKKECNEIKKLFTPANCAISRICGCYVDAEKNKVEYNGETTSLSPLAEKLRNVSAIQGASVFTYNGKKITDIAEETQWKEE